MKFSAFPSTRSTFRALNPFWVVVASPVLAAIYTRLGSKGKDLSMPMKFTLGMFMCSLGFLTAAAAECGLLIHKG